MTKPKKVVKRLSKKIVNSTKQIKVSKKWEKAPIYIKQDGIVYEKLFDGSVPMAFDLDDDVVQKIRTEARNGKYVSEQEFIRCSLREMLINRGN